jgi:hypothetical protein
VISERNERVAEILDFFKATSAALVAAKSVNSAAMPRRR